MSLQYLILHILHTFSRSSNYWSEMQIAELKSLILKLFVRIRKKMIHSHWVNILDLDF